MDIKRSDLPLLISLDALLDELNVTRAASRLSISQSTLSGQLSRLRDLFGDALLVPSPSGRGMVPTPRALELKSRLGGALVTLREAVTGDAPFDPKTSARTFVVAANDSVFTIAGLNVMATIAAQQNPLLRIAIVPAGDDDWNARMARGEVDLYLGAAAKVPQPLKSRFLLSDRFRLAQRIGHPRGLKPPTLGEYCSLPHVIVSDQAEFRTPIDDVLASLSHTRHVAMAVPSYNQVALVLAQTDGVATLPSRLLQRYTSLVDVIDLPFEIPEFQFAMGWHPRAQQDESLRWLRQCFLDAVKLPVAG